MQQPSEKEETWLLLRMTVSNSFIDELLSFHNFIKFDLLVDIVPPQWVSVTPYDRDYL